MLLLVHLFVVGIGCFCLFGDFGYYISLFFSRMLACLPHRAETAAMGCGSNNSIVFRATPVSFGLPGLSDAATDPTGSSSWQSQGDVTV